MYKIQETSLEWALLHLINFYDSDFFPKSFEFESIKRDWGNVKKYLLDVDLDNYAPKNSYISLAVKPNGTYRIVHQLDPLDSLIFTALIYENWKEIESYRIPAKRKIACSYRITPDNKGSYFEKDNAGYDLFLSRAEELATRYSNGVVLVCDIVDFYNQIYLHRVNNIITEAGSSAGPVIESFLSGLNTNVSRGIPVGPAPSILIAEAIMADIDKKILTYTSSFTRYVDDIYIFFKKTHDARIFLHELSKYLYSNHRLVLSSDKTEILSSSEFQERFLTQESNLEKNALRARLVELRGGPYPTLEEAADFDDLDPPEKLKVRSEAYQELFEESLELGEINLGLMRHILRQAGKYRVRSLIPLIFDNFDSLIPVIREVIIYFERVLTSKIVKRYHQQFKKLLKNGLINLPFVNIWIFTLFQNEHFNAIKLKIDYKKILRIREKALIARRERNLTWIKDIKGSLDTLGDSDKRAVIYSSILLSQDELVHWLGLESSKGDILTKAICSTVIGDKKSEQKMKISAPKVLKTKAEHGKLAKHKASRARKRK